MSLLDHAVIHLLRHGQTVLNAADVVCGATDVPLTGLGRRQADDAARAWRDLPIGRLILLRARQTADAFVRQRAGLRVEVAPLLAERDWGACVGQSRAAVARDATLYGGESPQAFRDRIRAGLATIVAPQGRPLIVAHSGTVREIMALLDLPFHRPGNCELLTLSRDERGNWSDTPPRPAPVTQVSNSKRIA